MWRLNRILGAIAFVTMLWQLRFGAQGFVILIVYFAESSVLQWSGSWDGALANILIILFILGWFGGIILFAMYFRNFVDTIKNDLNSSATIGDILFLLGHLGLILFFGFKYQPCPIPCDWATFILVWCGFLYACGAGALAFTSHRQSVNKLKKPVF